MTVRLARSDGYPPATRAAILREEVDHLAAAIARLAVALARRPR